MRYNRLLAAALFIISYSAISAANIQVVETPKDNKVTTNLVVESSVCNFSSKHEIFKAGSLFLVDDSLYMFRISPVELIRFSLDGKIMGRVSKRGRGPADLLRVWSIAELGDKLAVLDTNNQKIVFLKKNLEFVNEFRTGNAYMGITIDKSKRVILYGCQNSLENFYFHVFTAEGKPIGKFGRLKSPLNDRKKTKLFDSVNKALYIPEKNGLWACFKNRYDLRYYENDKLVLEIREREHFFSSEKSEMFGRTLMKYKGRSIQLARNGRYLHYFYRLNKNRYCDVFDLNTLRLLQRVSLKNRYVAIAHYTGGIFFGLAYQENEDDKDVVLYRIDWKNKYTTSNNEI